MKAKMIYTNKDHLRAEENVFSALSVPGVRHFSVLEPCNSGFMGFGVAITPSSCYELMRMDPAERKQLLRKIYAKDGEIGLSVARLCIGSSDYSAEIYSYDDVAFDTELKHFSIAKDEEYVIPIIKEILEIRPDLFFFASPWSPPYWMKTGGSMCGGYMRREFLDCYAEYIVKFVEAFAAHGIHVSALTPQNEPNTQQNSRMPACIWHPEDEAAYIKILKKKLTEKGLKTKIWMYDHNFLDINRVLWSLENCEGLAESCDGVAFHYYAGSIELTQVLKEKYPNLELHFSEGGPRLKDHYDTDWCKWGLMMIKALKMGYSSFTGWNLMLSETGGPNVGPFLGTCGGLVTNDHRTDERVFSGQYKAFAQIVPYVTKDAVIRPIKEDAMFNLNVSKFPAHEMMVEGVIIERPGHSKVAIIVNPNSGKMQTQLELDGNIWYLELQEDSVSTIIF